MTDEDRHALAEELKKNVNHRCRFSAGELWTTDYNGIIGFGRGIGKQHPGYQIVVVSVLKTIYEERKGKLKRI